MGRRGAGRPWTAEHARTLVDAWKESGLSGTKYARSIGVIPERLYWWERRLREERSRARKEPRLVPVTLRESALVATAARVVVTTTGGVRIEVNELDPTSASWVMALLAGGSSQ